MTASLGHVHWWSVGGHIGLVHRVGTLAVLQCNVVRGIVASWHRGFSVTWIVDALDDRTFVAPSVVMLLMSGSCSQHAVFSVDVTHERATVLNATMRQCGTTQHTFIMMHTMNNNN